MKNDQNNLDILFLDGLEVRHLNPATTFLSFLFPVGAILEKNNFTFKILNLSTLKDYNGIGLIEELKHLSFKAIGISTNSENIKFVYKVSQIIKKEFPEIPIIIGGPQASYSSEKILSETDVDVVIRHDGEFKLIKLLEYYLFNIGSLFEIKGITFKSNNNVIFNKDDIPVDINELPTPQYKVLTDVKYWVIPQKSFYDNFDFF